MIQLIFPAHVSRTTNSLPDGSSYESRDKSCIEFGADTMTQSSAVKHLRIDLMRMCCSVSKCDLSLKKQVQVLHFHPPLIKIGEGTGLTKCLSQFCRGKHMGHFLTGATLCGLREVPQNIT